MTGSIGDGAFKRQVGGRTAVNCIGPERRNFMGRKPFPTIIIMAAATLLPAPAQGDAQTDVQAGIDAWARGEHAAAAQQWKGPAASGDADAQFLLAEAYKQGQGVKQDLAKAEDLYGKAAVQGHIQASDIYGLLLFDRGQRVAAMPYVRAAAERGEPRAQYLLGLAHFNGDLAVKDWVRAYALVSLAQQAGLARATPALLQMDKYIALEQRQQAVALASELASQAEANLARQLASADLNAGPAIVRIPPAQPARSASYPTVASAQGAVAAAARAAGTESPRTAGADYARPAAPPPQVAVARPPTPAPAPARPPAPAPVVNRPAPAVVAATAVTSGVWRVQLGAFGVSANADAMWNKVRSRPELAGHPRINATAGKVIKLQAGGFASQEAARTACSRLADAGVSCLAVRS